MHRLLLLSGLILLMLLSVNKAHPIMLSTGSGLKLNLRKEDRFAGDYDGEIDIDLENDSRVGATQIYRIRQSDLYLENDSGSNAGPTGVNISRTPDYMLELYDKLSKRSPKLQKSNIIRSFKNRPDLDNNSTRTTENYRNHRVHSLVFDISSLDRRESINSAELRLYTLIKRDQLSYTGVYRAVSIYEIILIGNRDRNNIKYHHITSTYIYNVENAWESFDVTGALKRSLQQGLRIERLEVRIQSVFMESESDNLDINADSNDQKQPLLIVYSNDNSAEHELRVETHEILMHELDASSGVRASTQLGGNTANMYSYNAQNVILSRSKRSRGLHKLSVCKRRPLFVNFEDIGWHTWIIAPRGFQAYQCAGKCTFPLSDHLSPSKHAIIQTLMHTIHPKRAARSCCVPTKLDPISILYIDEKGVVTYKYRYDGMVVSECGCR